MLDSIKNLAVRTHPRIQSIDLLTSSSPDQFLKTLQGRIPNTSFALTTTNHELLQEIIFSFLILKFKGLEKTDEVLALVEQNQIQTSEELVAYFQAKGDKENQKAKKTEKRKQG